MVSIACFLASSGDRPCASSLAINRARRLRAFSIRLLGTVPAKTFDFFFVITIDSGEVKRFTCPVISVFREKHCSDCPTSFCFTSCLDVTLARIFSQVAILRFIFDLFPLLFQQMLCRSRKFFESYAKFSALGEISKIRNMLH
jgi:hypothetical protein